MAIDSVSITPGSGKDIATDTISAKEFPITKIALGAEDAYDLLVDSGQQAMTGCLPVVIASDQTAVPVTIATNSIQVDDAAFTPATSKISMIGAEFDDSSPDSVDEGDGGAIRMSGNRNLYVRIRDNAGNERGLNIDANGEIQISGSRNAISVNSTISAGATNIAKAEDVASADADVGVPAMAIRKASPANTSGTDGDYEMLQISAGRLWTSSVIDTALPAGSNAIGKLAANDGVDIGDVTLNNASIAVTKSGTWDITNAGTFVVQDSEKLVDNTGFTDGTTKLMPAGYIYDEVAGTALTENDVAAARINVNRALINIIEDGTTRGRYVTVTASNALKIDGSGVTQPVSGTVTASNTAGDVAHGSSNSGNPLQNGSESIAHGTNPAAVAAGQRTKNYANRAGIPFVIGGHPNILVNSVRLTGATTDGAIIAGTIATGTKVVITRLSITVSNATTINVGVRIGFAAATLAADSTTSAAGILIDSDGFPPGGGINIGDGSGIIGIGADGEEIRVTNDSPTSGTIHISASYYTIES